VALVAMALIGDGAVWRGWAVGGLAVMTLLATMAAYLRVKQGAQAVEGNWKRVLALVLPFIATVAIATGGLESPVLQLILPLTFFVAMFNAPRRVVIFGACLGVMLWCLAAVTLSGRVVDLIPRVFGGGSRAGHNDALLLTYATAMTLMIGWV